MASSFQAAGLIAALAAATLAGCARRDPPAPVVSGSAPTPRPAAVAPVPATVVVQAGDSLYLIARREKVPVRALIDANKLQAPYTLRPGQSLVVPAVRTHVVQPGESVATVARRHGVDRAALTRANGLQSPYALQAGQLLIIPGAAHEPVVAAAPAPAVGAAPAPAVAAVPATPVSSAPASPPPAVESSTAAPPAIVTAAVPPPPARPPAETAAPPIAPEIASLPQPAEDPPPPPRSGRAFAWPVRGNVISGFGTKPGGLQNDGINIAAARGTPVRAADSGVVVYAGNELKGFGNLLLLRHADGWMTAYAHLDEIGVERGQQVQRGQVVARVGQSGGVGSPQLHFEVRRGTRPVDPKDHLQPVISAAIR